METGTMPSSIMSNTVNIDTIMPSEHVRIRVDGGKDHEEEQPSMLASRLYERLGYNTPMYSTDRYHSSMTTKNSGGLQNDQTISLQFQDQRS